MEGHAIDKLYESVTFLGAEKVLFMSINPVRCALLANVNLHRALLFALVQQLQLQYSASKISLAMRLRLKVLWPVFLKSLAWFETKWQVAMLSRFRSFRVA